MKLLPGAWMRFVLSPTFLVGSLVLLILTKMQIVKLQVTNIPPTFLAAMERAFQNSKFKSQLNNWLAVSKMETGGFASTLYRVYNNPWGMRPSSIRQHTQSGSVQTNNGVFATYDSLEDAAQDIVLYMQARRYPEDSSSLLAFVTVMRDKRYFVGESLNSYYKKVVAWLER